MSARRLDLTMRQARTLLKAANAERGIVEVKMGDAVVRLIPEVLANQDDKRNQPVDHKEDWHL